MGVSGRKAPLDGADTGARRIRVSDTAEWLLNFQATGPRDLCRQRRLDAIYACAGERFSILLSRASRRLIVPGEAVENRQG